MLLLTKYLSIILNLIISLSSGNGDGFYSSAFQSQLIGNRLYNVSMPESKYYKHTCTWALLQHKIIHVTWFVHYICIHVLCWRGYMIKLCLVKTSRNCFHFPSLPATIHYSNTWTCLISMEIHCINKKHVHKYVPRYCVDKVKDRFVIWQTGPSLSRNTCQ